MGISWLSGVLAVPIRSCYWFVVGSGDTEMKILDEIKNLTVFHWIRLGICFGLFPWVRYITTAVIAGRAIEKVFIVYQMGIFERDNNYTFPNIVNNVYSDTILFESIIIFIIIYGLWFLLIIKFGLPKKIKIW